MSGRTIRSVAVLGAGLGGLAAAAVLACAGHAVTVFEAEPEPGGKCRRVHVGDEHFDTGPAILTFPTLLDALLERCQSHLDRRRVALDVRATFDVALERLPGVGRYLVGGEAIDLPVPPGHPLAPAWERFLQHHVGQIPTLTQLLTTRPEAMLSTPLALSLLVAFRGRSSLHHHLAALGWLPPVLRRVVGVHALNAGIGTRDALPLMATIVAAMARHGVWHPRGGMYELVSGLARLLAALGVELRLAAPVRALSADAEVVTDRGAERFDQIVSDLDPFRTQALLDERAPGPTELTCSGVALYGLVEPASVAHLAEHTVLLPEDDDAMSDAMRQARVPSSTMAYVHRLAPERIPGNRRTALAVLLTAPADGDDPTTSTPWVARELARVEHALGLPAPVAELCVHARLTPFQLARWGSQGGAIYGARHPYWRSGPFHPFPHRDRSHPWLYRVGGGVHPGGGVPAVLGGALMATERALADAG